MLLWIQLVHLLLAYIYAGIHSSFISYLWIWLWCEDKLPMFNMNNLREIFLTLHSVYSACVPCLMTHASSIVNKHGFSHKTNYITKLNDTDDVWVRLFNLQIITQCLKIYWTADTGIIHDADLNCVCSAEAWWCICIWFDSSLRGNLFFEYFISSFIHQIALHVFYWSTWL